MRWKRRRGPTRVPIARVALNALAVLTLAVMANGCGDDIPADDPSDTVDARVPFMDAAIPDRDARVPQLDARVPDADARVDETPEGWPGHGPIAEGISAAMGEPLPGASETQREAFARGREVLAHRFTRAEGLGPAFNVTFCGACHEKPVPGGSAGLYRNFQISGVVTDDGAFFPGESAGMSGGVIRIYANPTNPVTDAGTDALDAPTRRPAIPEATNLFATRNPIPFFGAGLLAELTEDEILARADPDDVDGDGISGRANYDRGFVGRFGRKAQTVSLEGFIRGPLFNHLGITSNPLDEARRAKLPVDSSGGGERAAAQALGALLRKHAQAAAPESPLTDDDAAPDPELSADQLFDLVSFTMLLAAPEITPLEAMDEQARRGGGVFDALGCGSCHTPRLTGPRGPIPLYSDLLLHDMGDALADGVVQNEATGREFRTQPLWGLAAVGPYLHDGRASSVAEAIALHGGEGAQAARAFRDASPEDRQALLAFLDGLGGRDQASPGLVPPDAPEPEAGAWGGPLPGLSTADRMTFAAGRAVFDFEFGLGAGVGSPRFNGDSCRACHFEPVLGGAGPRGVDVMRHGRFDPGGGYVAPSVGSILHRTSAELHARLGAEAGTTLFEPRQTPHVFGMGLLDGIPRATIEAQADPDDADGDGISGRAAVLPDGRLGRFGWKAQVPSLVEFVRDAVTAELGMTLPAQAGLTFGREWDDDDVADPEVSLAEQDLLADFLRLLAPPPRTPADNVDQAARGEALFAQVGCTDCHTPSLAGTDGPVPLYSDLLLHAILPDGERGIAEGAAAPEEYRTAPLWGAAKTAPYMHDGAADTLGQAIERHAGEASASRERVAALTDADRQALLAFLRTL